MACPTQLLDGRCWTLGALGQSCADVCGGSRNVDVGALETLASRSATIDHLEALYGCHTTSRDGADQQCGPPAESMFAFIPLGFRNFGGEGRWHCLYGETYMDVTPSVRSPCVCLSRAASALLPLRSRQYHALSHTLFFPPRPPPPPSPPRWLTWWEERTTVSDRVVAPGLHWEVVRSHPCPFASLPHQQR